MNHPKPDSNNWEATQKSKIVRLRYWTLAWLLSLALARFGPESIWAYHTGLSVLGIVLNLVIGAGMIIANKAYLRGLDEMQQKIFLDATALSLGVGLICGLGYEQLEDIQLITFQPEISHLICLMSVTFIVGIEWGNKALR